MFPLLNSDQNPRSRRLAMTFVLVGVFVLLGLVLLYILSASGTEIPLYVIMLVALPLLSVPLSLYAGRKSDRASKGKRDLVGLDLYSVIDRLVDDVDDDEAAHLRRRLDERDAKRKDDLTVSLDDLLEQRSDDRKDR